MGKADDDGRERAKEFHRNQIIALSPDYTYALVGDPAREYLWILSRSPQMDDATYNRLVEEARMQGFDVSRLRKTRQPGS